MTRLNSTARATLRAHGLGPTAWAVAQGYADAASWRGDVCGCSDDRCIGYHHDENEECGCLPATIEQHEKDLAARAAGKIVWDAHLHANDTQATKDREAADAQLAAWIAEHQGTGATAHWFNATPPGLAYRNIFNDRDWLVWDAETGGAAPRSLTPTTTP